MNRITAVIAILVLIPSYQLHSTSVMAFGEGKLLSLIPEYLNGENCDYSMFLWMFHPQNYKQKNLPSGFPVDYFLVLSDHQIKFLTETSVLHRSDSEIYTEYAKNIKRKPKELLKDEVEFVMMVYLFRELTNPNETNIKDYENLKSFLKEIENAGGITDANELGQSYFDKLKEFLKTKTINEDKIKDQYLSISSALFYTIDAIQIFSAEKTGDDKNAKKDFKKIKHLANHLISHSTYIYNEHKDILIKKYFEEIQLTILIPLKNEVIERMESLLTGTFNKKCETIFDAEMKLNEVEPKYYSYRHTKEQEVHFITDGLLEWAKGFLIFVQSNSGNIKSNSNEAILSKVIYESFLKGSIQSFEPMAHEISGISHRLYYAYSVGSGALMKFIKYVFEKSVRLIGDNKKMELFTLISTVLEDYLTFYPVLLENNNDLVVDTFADSLLTQLKNSYIDLSKDFLDKDDNRKIVLKFKVLAGIKGINYFLENASYVGRNAAPIYVLAVSSDESIFNEDYYDKLIDKAKSMEKEIEPIINAIKSDPTDYCKKIIKVQKDDQIIGFEDLKKNFKQKLSKTVTTEKELI
jgi:hypothetical protein